jgi:hypothetical protein
MFEETTFINGFVRYYTENILEEYDLTLIFDQYVIDFLIGSSNSVYEHIVESYGEEDDVEELRENMHDLEAARSIVSYVLYEKFYDTVLELVADNSQSDADTDYGG